MRNSALCVDALLSVGHSQGNGYVGMQGRIGSGFIAIGRQPFLSSVYVYLTGCMRAYRYTHACLRVGCNTVGLRHSA